MADTSNPSRAVALFPRSSKCPKPKMDGHRGAVWGNCKLVDTEGREHTGYLNIVWGEYFYFEYRGQWRKAKMGNHMHLLESYDVDFRDVK
jgi:hypothetical protein